jgi:hypothetical protein
MEEYSELRDLLEIDSPVVTLAKRALIRVKANVLPRPDFVGIAGQLSESVPLSDGAIFGHASSRHCPTVLHPDLDSEVQAGTIGAGLTSRDYFAQYFQTL